MNAESTITRTSSSKHAEYHIENIYYPKIDQISLIMKETFYGIALVPKKYHLCMFLKRNDIIKESQYSTKIKYILLIHLHAEIIFGIQQSHVDQKLATMLYN